MEPHASGLLSTLVISLVAAFAGGLAARSIKLPPLLGYLLAGILVGPFTPGFHANQAVAAELAEVGVALLLFNIGLHFSLKDLVIVRKIVILGALFQMLVSGTLGFVVVRYVLNLPFAAALLIGLSLSVASTAISTRLLEERRQLSTPTGRIAMGWLVMQDIVVILATVILPALVQSKDMALRPLAAVLTQTLLQIAGFAVVIFFGVRRFIPRLLSYVARIGSRELFTLSVIVIALGIAYGSSMLFGVSLALGAFFAGVVIGESDFNHHAAAEALSMQQVFTILFFVSVGMLFDPHSLLHMPVEIMTCLTVVLLGIGLVTFIILLALRFSPEGAAIVGGAFAQVGEFSFVLSQLGQEWGLLDQNAHDLILVVAFMSIMLNPLIMFIAPRFGRFLSDLEWMERWRDKGETHIPESIQSPADHVIIIGHGRVGHMITDALQKHDISWLAIESDRALMEKRRKLDMPVIFGDATREPVLAAAHPETARLLICATPYGTHTRRIVALARRLNPALPIIVRAHEDAEARHITRMDVNLVVVGEREIAFGLTAFALQHYGVESHVVLETLSTMREQLSTVVREK